jgi:hypothetical protein
MADILFVKPDGKAPVRLEATPYDLESDFQELLSNHSELLSGEQIDPEQPRRWLLIANEMGVPDQDLAGGRWALDHLFVDQDAIPTLVEVKRQSDTRIRREVVGQLLEYAANGVSYWSEAKLHECFAAQCSKDKVDPDVRVREFLQDQVADSESFIARVHGNLGSGRIRLIFFADRIPPELQRIVDFLTRHLREEVEVFAFELQRFKGGGFETHVPRVVGAHPRVVKPSSSASPRHQWNEEEFFGAAAQLSRRTQQALRQAYELSRSKLFRQEWGTGKITGSFLLFVQSIGQVAIARFKTTGSMCFTSAGLGRTEVAKWVAGEFLGLAKDLFGSEVPADADTRYEFSIDEESWVPASDKILAKLEWVATESKLRFGATKP